MTIFICAQCAIEFSAGIKGKYRFCSEKCRFMNKIRIDETTGCWIWQAHIQHRKGGYGTFVPEICKKQKSALAHRVSYRLFKGKLSNNKYVLHSCHNSICVAPDHLRLGTAMENTVDRRNAGRTTNHGKKIGEKNGF